MSAPVILEDLTHYRRLGLKGPGSVQWLLQNGLPVPDGANSWCATSSDEHDIIVRLGSSEFLIERSEGSELRRLSADLTALEGVYPVLREDRVFLLSGAMACDVLAEMCNVNFSALRVEAREAIMTLMIGVAVTVVPQGNAAQRRYRIWCDPSYGDYLWSSLLEVARALHGRNCMTNSGRRR